MLVFLLALYAALVGAYELNCTRTESNTCYISDVTLELNTECITQTFDTNVSFSNCTIIVDNASCGFDISLPGHQISFDSTHITATIISITADDFVLSDTSTLSASTFGSGAAMSQTGTSGGGGGHAGYGGRGCLNTALPGTAYGDLLSKTPGGDARASDISQELVAYRGGGVVLMDIKTSMNISGPITADGDGIVHGLPLVPIPTRSAFQSLYETRDSSVLSASASWERTDGLRGLLQWLRIAALHQDEKDMEVSGIETQIVRSRVPLAFSEAARELRQLRLSFDQNTEFALGEADAVKGIHDERRDNFMQQQLDIITRAFAKIDPAITDLTTVFSTLQSSGLIFSHRLFRDVLPDPTRISSWISPFSPPSFTHTLSSNTVPSIARSASPYPSVNADEDVALGGAAGGSIHVRVYDAASDKGGSVFGAGVLSALGGTGRAESGGGSGGRVVVLADAEKMKVRVTVHGGFADDFRLDSHCESGAGGFFVTLQSPDVVNNVVCQSRLSPAANILTQGLSGRSLSLTTCKIVTTVVNVTDSLDLVDSILASSNNIINEEAILEVQANMVSLTQSSFLSASILGITAANLTVDLTSALTVSLMMELDINSIFLQGTAKCVEDAKSCSIDIYSPESIYFASSIVRASAIRVVSDSVSSSGSTFTATMLYKTANCSDIIESSICDRYHPQDRTLAKQLRGVWRNNLQDPSLSDQLANTDVSGSTPWIGDNIRAHWINRRLRRRHSQSSTDAVRSPLDSVDDIGLLSVSPRATLSFSTGFMTMDSGTIMKGAIVGICGDGITSAARVDVSGFGCPSDMGVGVGISTDMFGGGGAYGGNGGNVAGMYDVRTGGISYAVSGLPPTRMGSGGAESATDASSGGAAGGYIYIAGKSMLMENAFFTADGLQSRVGAGGGGSGGAIYVVAETYLSTMTRFSVMGGGGWKGGGGGGGGVIFVNWLGEIPKNTGTIVLSNGGAGGPVVPSLTQGYSADSALQSQFGSDQSGENGEHGLVQAYPTCIAGTAGMFCSPCNPGYYSDEPGQTACTPCKAGTYQPNAGKSHCFDCQAGSSSKEGDKECTKCEPGYFSPSDGAKSCTACDPGLYSGEGSKRCEPCRPNTYSTGTAAWCDSCDIGYYTEWGQSSCSACEAAPDNAAFSGPGCDYDCDVGLVYPVCIPPFERLAEELGSWSALAAAAVCAVAIMFSPYLFWCGFAKKPKPPPGVDLDSVSGDVDHIQMAYITDRVALRASDLPRHAYRLYFSGSNHYSDPLRLSPVVHADLAAYVSEAPFARLAAQVNAACLWTPAETRTYLFLCLYYPLAMRYHTFVQRRKLAALTDVIARSDNSFLCDPRAKALADSLRFGHSSCLSLAWVDILHAYVPTHALTKRSDGGDFTRAQSLSVSPALTDFSSLRAGGLAGPVLPMVLLCAGTGHFSAPFHLDCADPLLHSLDVHFGSQWGALIAALNDKLRALPLHRALTPKHLTPVISMLATINKAGAAHTAQHFTTDSEDVDTRVVLSLGLVQPSSLHVSRLARTSHRQDAAQSLHVSLLDYSGYSSPNSDVLSLNAGSYAEEEAAQVNAASRGVFRLAIVARRVSVNDAEWLSSLEARAEEANGTLVPVFEEIPTVASPTIKEAPAVDVGIQNLSHYESSDSEDGDVVKHHTTTTHVGMAQHPSTSPAFRSARPRKVSEATFAAASFRSASALLNNTGNPEKTDGFLLQQDSPSMLPSNNSLDVDSLTRIRMSPPASDDVFNSGGSRTNDNGSETQSVVGTPKLFNSTARVFVNVGSNFDRSSQYNDYANRLQSTEKSHDSHFDTQYDVVSGMYLPVHRDASQQETSTNTGTHGSPSVNRSLSFHPSIAVGPNDIPKETTQRQPSSGTAARRHRHSLKDAALRQLENGAVSVHRELQLEMATLDFEPLPYDCVPVSRVVALPQERRPKMRYPWWQRIASKCLVHRPRNKAFMASHLLVLVFLLLYCVLFLAINVIFAQLMPNLIYIWIFVIPPLVPFALPLLTLVALTIRAPSVAHASSLTALFAFLNGLYIMFMGLYGYFVLHDVKEDALLLPAVLCLVTLLLPIAINSLAAHMTYRMDLLLCKPYQTEARSRQINE